MKTQNWRKIKCLAHQLQLVSTLTGGQSFRWKKHEKDTYIGVAANCVWLLRQSETDLEYKIVDEIPYPEINDDIPTTDDKEPKRKKLKSQFDSFHVRMKIDRPKVLKNAKKNSLIYPDEYYDHLLQAYFRFDVNLEHYYETWSKSHRHFKENAGQFYAVRMLNQDPVENLFSFICSQNNHISRISGLVEKLCTLYGSKICDFNGVSYHAFPDIATLAGESIEQELRTASFGYRAKFINKSAHEILAKGGLKWFHDLQQLDYKKAHTELISLTGIGPKVADCICLMSLNHLQAIPVDTHVFQIAAQNYLPQISKAKSVTPKIYAEIGDKFREIYGPLAGWAQTVLFCADLKKFKTIDDHGGGDGVKIRKKKLNTCS